MDEEESEMTLSFWYLLQESLWSVDWATEEDDGPDAAEAALLDWAESKRPEREAQEMPTNSNIMAAMPIYMELITVMKRKVTWPPQNELATWPRGALTISGPQLSCLTQTYLDQVDKFQV